jgi:hypothetical protein
MASDNLHEQAPAYVVDALDDAERAAFEAHLVHCAACRDEVAALGGAAGALAFAAEAPPPPPELRERILAAARAEGPPNVVPLRSRRRWLPIAGAVAAVAAAVAVGIGLWQGLDSGGSQHLAWSLAVGSGGAARLRVEGLKPAPPGKVYEIWVLDGGAPRPAGTFPGGGVSTVPLTRPVRPGERVLVTLERSPGVGAPTSQPLLTATA